MGRDRGFAEGQAAVRRPGLRAAAVNRQPLGQGDWCMGGRDKTIANAKDHGSPSGDGIRAVDPEDCREPVGRAAVVEYPSAPIARVCPGRCWRP